VVSSDYAQEDSGGYGIRISNRFEPWSGVGQNIDVSTVSVGVPYAVSVGARLVGAASSNQPFKLTLYQVDDSGLTLLTVIDTSLLSSLGWTRFEGTVTINPTGPLGGLFLVIDSTPAGIDVVVDNVVMMVQPTAV